ncbi:hypothetical protein B0H11DRAFT_1937464 [Mycena galericulata]|nr:hypothetical protein B0H11DRAFT_1937464 [Mycena galericulata]
MLRVSTKLLRTVAFLLTNTVLRTVDEVYIRFTENFTNHNPNAIDGLASSFGIVKPIFADPAVAIEDRWVLARADCGRGRVFVGGGSCIVEHWDIIQERPVNATNPNPLF